MDATAPTADARALTAALEPRLSAYIEELRQLCAIECPTAHKPGVDEAGAWVRRWAAARGWATRAWPDERAGDTLAVTLPGGNPAGPRILLVAHLDTVYPAGTAAGRPLRREGDRLIGPGSADNKSGLLSGLHALAALEDCGLLASFGALTLVCGGDEETDMRASGAVPRALAPDHAAALVLEAARETGELVSARKGNAGFTLEVRGRAAHAGVEPHQGANAILALAQQIVALQLLNGFRPGVTVNAGVIAGGTLPNVVADAARAEVDVRAALPEDLTAVRAAIGRIVAAPAVPGTTATLVGEWSFPPMPRTPEVAALAALAADCARELGFAVADVATGGVSYANLLVGHGLPVLDGLGPVGGRDHGPDEHILASSIVPRTALLALLCLRLAQQPPRPPL